MLLRISHDKAGDEHGISKQEKKCRELAERLGWTITEVVKENDVSAYKRKRTRLPNGAYQLRTDRPEYRRVLDLLAFGHCDGLIAYDLDRVVRDPRDLEDLIDVVESVDPRIPVESVTGSLRLGNDSEVMMARFLVTHANQSSRDKARRVSLERERLASLGRPQGGGVRPFGYADDRITVIDSEAEEIRKWAERVLDPDEPWNTHQIARDLNKRGVPTVRGGKWNHRTVQVILTGPRIVGISVHKGNEVGKAVWPAILPRTTWDELRAVLGDRSGKGGQRNTLVRWLTGVLVCGHEGCGSTLRGGSSYKKRVRYWCNPTHGGCGKIAIDAVLAEEEIQRQVLEYLTDPVVLDRLRGSLDRQRGGDLRAKIAADEADLTALVADWAHKRITREEWLAARGPIAERIRRSRQLLVRAAPKAVKKILQATDIAEAWASLEPAEKRDVVLVCVKGYRVLPYTASGPRKFDPARLKPIPLD
jgi:site-specific DNA recombinase